MDAQVVSSPVRLLAAADEIVRLARTAEALPTTGFAGWRARNRLSIAYSQAAAQAREAAAAVNSQGDIEWARAGVQALDALLPVGGRSPRPELRQRLLDAGEQARELTADVRRNTTAADAALRPGSNAFVTHAYMQTRLLAARDRLDLVKRMDSATDPAGAFREHFLGIVRRDPDDLTRTDWHHLSRLLADSEFAALRPVIPESPKGYLAFGEAVDRLATSSFQPGGGTRRVFAEISRQLEDADTPARDVIRRYVFRDPASLTGTEWARLERAMRDAAPDALPPRRIETAALPLERIIGDLIDGKYRPDRGTRAWIHSWREALEPGYRARHASALVDSVGTGRFDNVLTVHDVRPGAPIWKLVDVPPAELPAIQHRMQLLALAEHPPVTRHATREWLDDLEPLLEGIPVDRDGTPQLLQRARDMIRDNRLRLARHTPDGLVRGYANYPEYAELGRIGSNVQLLAHAAWQPQPVPVRAQAAAAAGEVLTW